VKKLFLFSLACLGAIALFAQDSTYSASQTQRNNRNNAKKQRVNNMMRQEEEGELIFNKHSIFGVKLATDGYGISYERGKFKSNTRTVIYQFELNEIKSEREAKISAANDPDGVSSYIFGKENNFYQFKVSMGQQHRIGGKGNKNGVAVTALYTGGLSAGILKPYLVNVVDQYNNTFKSTYPTIVDSGYLEESAAGFFSGWNQLKIKPGLNAKTALRFDWGRFNESITAIEVGISGEYYFSKIPIMMIVPEQHFFFNGYVTILFGKRK
jgi:hypothetical protein